jgi:4-amino-4-deoxy-L-arabinose transferase-like glycosyltransferase
MSKFGPQVALRVAAPYVHRLTRVRRLPIVIPIGVTVLLIAFAWGYGYHRDELYFIAAGDHLAWGYADQGPLTPLIARGMTELAPNSLTVLRIPSALAAGVTVLLTGLIARELHGSTRAQAISAATAAVAALVLATGHLLSTATFDLLVWTAVTWLTVRAVRSGQDWLFLIAGVTFGIGLLNKPLPAFLALGLLVGVAIAGPRRLLASPWVWSGAAIALAMWAPWLVWQADHGWPQIDVSRSIAEGNSTSSQPWWALVPFQLLLVSPMLAPVWIAGLVALFRAPTLRDVRFLGWAWVVLAVVFVAAGGKPYYLAGLLPALIAAGAIQADAWLDRGRRSLRRGLLLGAIALSAVVGVTIALPVLPAKDADPVVELNPDIGETIGWPELARTVDRVDHRLGDPSSLVILTDNYGEAGAVDRFGPGLGLPQAYSGHNAYDSWGPPPAGGRPVIAVGIGPREASAHLRGCRAEARIQNSAAIDNDEDREPVTVCSGPRSTWARIWPKLRHLG